MTKENNIRAVLETHFSGFKEEIIDSAVDRLMEITEKVRHGKWIDPEDPTCYKCSVCGEYATQEYGLTGPIFWRYCPNCGAKME